MYYNMYVQFYIIAFEREREGCRVSDAILMQERCNVNA